MRIAVKRLDRWLRRQSRLALLVAGLGMVAGLGYADFVTGPDLTPLIFYLMPIVFAAWYAGMGPGAVVASASELAWWLSDALTHGAYVHPSIPYWNIAIRFLVLVFIALGVARLRVALDRERDMARTDQLTGVANLRAFYEIANAEIARARRYGRPFTVAFIDLDEFKRVNDGLGHAAGDALLRGVARAIATVLRASDSVARMGGDEFVVLLPETGAAPARQVIEKLRQALADVAPEQGGGVTASVGVVTYPVAPESVDALVGNADRLMYAAKGNGKNSVMHETCVF